VFWHLGFDDLNGFGDGFWVGVNGNSGQCQSFACTDISATAPLKKTVLTVDTMENTVSCTDALGQPIPEALVAGGESKPGSPQPIDLNSTAIGSCLVAVAVAVAFTLLICEHQLAVDTVSIE
jgi:hypothetical protein